MTVKRLSSIAAVGACALALAMCSGKKGSDDATTDPDAADTVDEDVTDLPDAQDVVDASGDTTTEDVPADATDATEDALEDAPGDSPPDAGDAIIDAADVTHEDGLDAIMDPVDEDPALDTPPDTAADTGLDATDAEEEEVLSGHLVTGTIWRSLTFPVGGDASHDCVGPLMIAFYRCEPFVDRSCDTTPLAVHTSTGDADLSDASVGYPYSVRLDDWGELYILAVLDDDGSGLPSQPWISVPVEVGDMSSHPPTRYTIPWTGDLSDADVTLDLRASRVTGQVTLSSGAGYTGTGTGDLHVGIVDSDPASGGPTPILLGNAMYAGVDVLDGTPETYFIVFLAPASSTVYGVALLDDDADGMLSETGEPLSATGAPLSVTAMGASYTLDIVMDAVAP